jgi:phosphoserine phosphatase RsbU/P
LNGASPMPSQILTAYQGQLTTLAQAWLASGATGFGVYVAEQPLLLWPPHVNLENASLQAPVLLGDWCLAELRATGLDSVDALARLQAEARLVAQLIRLERDMNNMTAELIDTQDQLLALYDLTHATRNYLDIEQILRRFAYEITRLLNVESAFALLQLPSKPTVTKQYPVALLSDEDIYTYFRLVQEKGEMLLLDEKMEVSLPPGIRNLFIIPVQIRGRIVVALGLLNKQGGDFSSPDLKLVQAIAEHAGARIENVLLYQENLAQTRMSAEMELAHQVQLNLLPQQPPSILGLELWASSRPASQVGGDFYDFIAKPGVPFTFTVGDVSGKGMPAALLMAMTRTVTRNKTNSNPAPTPQMVIGHANEDMYDDFTDVSMFATMFVGQYNPGNKQLLYANAGHAPVIYCPAGGKAHLLEADGTALGIFPQSLSEDQSLSFEAGDVLVVATDGLNEARNGRDEMFGYDRLIDLVESCARLPASAIGDHLYQSVNEFSGDHPQDDDQTLVVLKGAAN